MDRQTKMFKSMLARCRELHSALENLLETWYPLYDQNMNKGCIWWGSGEGFHILIDLNFLFYNTILLKRINMLSALSSN